MYSDMEENEKKINWVNIFIKVTIVVVVLILLIWIISLFTKKGGNSSDTNISLIKEASIKYFDDDKLPSVNGTSKKIYLNDLYDSGLLSTLKDSKNKKCNASKSYVNITKYNDGYNMKIYLNCPSYKKTKTFEMKKYSYCRYAICEYNSAKGSSLVSSSSSSSSTKSSSSSSPSSSSVVKSSSSSSSSKSSSSSSTITNVKYKYVKPAYYTEWSSFSDWQTDSVESSETVNVETKVENVVKTNQQTVQNLLKVDTICPDGYTLSSGSCVKSIVSTADPVCPKDGAISRNGFTCTYSSTSESEKYLYTAYEMSSLPSNTSSRKYELVKTQYKVKNGKGAFVYTYKVYEITSSTSTYNRSATCPTNYSKSNGQCVSTTYSYADRVCPSNASDYTISSDKTYCYKYVNGVVNNDYTVQVTYYRYATRQYIAESVKYSYSNNDTDLINQGYKLS